MYFFEKKTLSDSTKERERDRSKIRTSGRKRTRLGLFLSLALHWKEAKREGGEREWKQRKQEEKKKLSRATWHEAEALSSSHFFLVSIEGEEKKQKTKPPATKTHAAMVSSALNASARGVAATNKGACLEREAKRETAANYSIEKRKRTLKLRALPARRCCCWFCFCSARLLLIPFLCASRCALCSIFRCCRYSSAQNWLI